MHIQNIKTLKFKQLIDDIIIDFLFSKIFSSIENIRRKYNLIVNLLKFTTNKKYGQNLVTKLI